MNKKNAGLFTRKKMILFLAAVVLLSAAFGTALLLGVFKVGAGRGAAATSDSAEAQSSVYREASSMKITAQDSDSLGVSPTSSFRLSFSGSAPDEKALSKALRIEPAQAFRLKKVSRSQLSMSFDKPLENDTIYRFTLSDSNTGAKQSWAFQTKQKLNIVRTLPRDKSVQVPVNSGIEITFTNENIQNAEKYFEITPKTSGRFELHKKTLVFVPDKLQAATVYKITVKKGIGVTGSDDKLENDYTFRFQTEIKSESSNEHFFTFSDTLYSLPPQAVPALQVYTGEKVSDREIPVELFSYPDAESFLKDLKKVDQNPSWVVSQSVKPPYEEAGLQKAASVRARLSTRRSSYWNTTYLVLPSSLPEGYYLVRAETDGKKYYAQLQVHAASVYILTTKDKTLAWLNDSKTGKPLSGAEVRLDGGAYARSDKDGLAVLNEKLSPNEDIAHYYFLVKPVSGSTFISQVESSSASPYTGSYSNSDTTDRYWTYLYLDKGIYLPEDTINIWGVAKPRDADSAETDAVLELIRYDYSASGDENISVLASCRTKLSPKGTFSGSLKLSNYNPGSYNVRLKVGDKVLVSNYLQVMDYTKPAYRIDVTSDRSSMYAWEKVNFDIKAAFYEGTPVSGLKLDYNSSVSGATLDGSASGTGKLTSDASGTSSVTLCPQTPEEGWRPLTLSFNAGSREGEEREINGSCNVAVFPKDTMIEMKPEADGSNGSITLSTSRIDLDKLKDRSDSFYTEDDYRGAAVDMPLKAKLYERYYVPRKTGEYYDFINKVKRETYEYNEEKKLVKEYSLNTVNGKCKINYSIQKDKNYYIEVYGADSKGRSIKETEYLYIWNNYSPYNAGTYSISSDCSGKTYREGETVPVEVRNNSVSATGGNHCKYLFIRMKSGVVDYTVQPDAAYRFTFKKEFIPNVYVKAVCFDGTNIYDAGIEQYTYDRNEQKLEISAHADKKSYKPGDTVKMTFSVKDAKGKPCSSEINVSAVDEAYFAVEQQSADTLAGLYGPSVSSGMISDYFSYQPVKDNGAPMAEGGEGGDAYVRKDFRDSALFRCITSDAKGRAEVSFKLPDNLTSWRITYQAVTDDVRAGSGKLNVSSKLPFFVDTVFNKAFITGDSPSLLARAYGSSLLPSADVSYKIMLTVPNGSNRSFTAEGKANTAVEIPLGKLPQGDCKVRVEAASGSMADALERSFRVSDSLLETTKNDYTALTDSTMLVNHAKGLTSLVFFGKESSLLYDELHALYWSWGQRLDQKLAGKIAGEMLHKRFQEKIYQDEEFNIGNYQMDDGGLALLTYGSSDPEVSAEMCSLAANDIDRGALTTYFRGLLEKNTTTPEDSAYAYWGLAALREPVLLDIQNRLGAGGATPEVKLILGVALAELGDFNGAKEIYDEFMGKYGRQTDTFAYIENGTRDDSIKATALCSLIALRIGAPERLKLFEYIKSNSTSELLVNMERLIFIQNYIKQVSSDYSFSFELDGMKKHVDLKNGSYYRMELTPRMLSSIRFSDVKGNIVACSSFVAPVSELRPSDGTIVSVTRSYRSESRKGTPASFSRSDIVRVTLVPGFGENAPDGCYEITDILPAGLKYVSGYPGKGSTDWYADEVTGQKVVFGYYYRKTAKNPKSIVYFARAVTPGTYTADNAAIRHSESNVSGYSDRVSVTVGK